MCVAKRQLSLLCTAWRRVSEDLGCVCGVGAVEGDLQPPVGAPSQGLQRQHHRDRTIQQLHRLDFYKFFDFVLIFLMHCIKQYCIYNIVSYLQTCVRFLIGWQHQDHRECIIRELHKLCFYFFNVIVTDRITHVTPVLEHWLE